MKIELEAEIDRLNKELGSAEADVTRLQARIQGLRAERDSLARALAAQRSDDVGPQGLSPTPIDAIRKRTEAIQALLRRVGRPMTIDEVREALNEEWREPSSYAVVASTLNLLHRTNRVAKVARGRYATA